MLFGPPFYLPFAYESIGHQEPPPRRRGGNIGGKRQLFAGWHPVVVRQRVWIVMDLDRILLTEGACGIDKLRLLAFDWIGAFVDGSGLWYLARLQVEEVRGPPHHRRWLPFQMPAFRS
jgi:hypothetical protein